MIFHDGCYDNVSNEEYHADREYISSSGLKLFPDKKDEYIVRYQTETEQEEESEALMLGTAIHCMILEPGLFYKQYIVAPVGLDKRKTKDKKTILDLQHQSMTENKIVISSKHFDLIKKTSESVKNHPIANSLLSDTTKEQSFFLEDDGLKQKVRADAVNDNLIIDLKTIDDVNNFPDSVIKFGYHFSAMMYKTIINKYLERNMDFVFVVVQKKYPYTCIVRELSQDLIDIGLESYNKAKESYRKIQKTGDWDFVQKVELPKWFKHKGDI